MESLVDDVMQFYCCNAFFSPHFADDVLRVMGLDAGNVLESGSAEGHYRGGIDSVREILFAIRYTRR